MPTQRPYAQYDLSGGLQTSTSRLLKKENQVIASKNAAYNIIIGSAVRRPGYEQVGESIAPGNDGLYGGVFKSGEHSYLLAAHNNAAGTATILRYLDNGGYWTDLTSAFEPNTYLDAVNHLDELYVCGSTLYSEKYAGLINIDGSKNVSTTRNVYAAPKAKFITEYSGKLVALNVQIGNAKYKDRAYISSGPVGVITYVQNAQKGLLKQLSVDSVRYLKAGMTIDIYSAGTNYKAVDSLYIISVDKNRNVITFADTTIDLKDNDEIWLEDRKGMLSELWNTDYPNEQNADFLRIPPGTEEDSEITGYGNSNNRLFIFTKNSFWRWDGANFINMSPNVGCTSHRTIQNIGSWMLWLHTSGVWGYNDSTGQLKLLSRAVSNYIDAATQLGKKMASAVVNGRVYKLSLGELLPIDSATTSTSTSSTSTSSTSSSTSSTSTSSTSTSSTSSSTSISSTSTSSTSVSTSSTSVSTSSTSVSTSTSSTSISTSTSSTTTTTLASSKQVVRLIYDFDSNAWWTEYHKREFRYQFMHTMHGYTKPYFVDETGRMFRDETTDKDHFDTIPMEIELGRSAVGSRFEKTFSGCLVQSEKAGGAQVSVSIDNGEWRNVGQISSDIQEIKFDRDLPSGRDINYKITTNDTGEAAIIDGVETYSSIQENRFG